MNILPEIPVIVSDGPLDLVTRRRDLLTDIFASVSARFPRFVLKNLDRISERWLKKHKSAHAARCMNMAQAANEHGLLAMNLMFEWGCTTGAGKTGESPTPKMIRILDWKLPGLGRNLVVSVEPGRAGPFLNITWPGFYGVVTAMAPGRFALALNQAPLKRITSIEMADRFIQTFQMYGHTGMPVTFLLREVLETAGSYQEAVDMITDSDLRVATPGLITITGKNNHEACIIERLARQSIVHNLEEQPIAVSNDWLQSSVLDWPRSAGTPHERRIDCIERKEALLKQFPNPFNDFSWLKPPVLNENSRLAFFADVANHHFMLQGFDVAGDELPVPVTALLSMDCHALLSQASYSKQEPATS